MVPFAPMDLVELGSRVKFMNVIDSAQGLTSRELAVYYCSRSSEYSNMYFTQAIDKFQDAVRANPNKVENLIYAAEALWRSCENFTESNADLTTLNRRLSAATEYLEKALKLVPSNTKKGKALTSVIFYRKATISHFHWKWNVSSLI